MYKKKIPLDLDCGVRIAIEVMGGKWKSCILYRLEEGNKRPSELHRLFKDANPRVINQQLKELEKYGMIRKTIFPEVPPCVEYAITDDGRSLLPIVHLLKEWGERFRPKMEAILEKERFDIEPVEKERRSPVLKSKLLHIWKMSVRASHRFLTETDIDRLATQAGNALLQVKTLLVVWDNGQPVGFMGVQDRKIEMLFLHPDYFRKGLGKTLVQLAFDELSVEFVDVNEQNPDAVEFYSRMGFKVFKRNEHDSEGNPFPILEMKRLTPDGLIDME